jgi:feruloyl esterase
MGVGYYEQVRETMGPDSDNFFQLFMMPGVFHCAGGVGPDLADTITPLFDWVERESAPERIIATRKVEEQVVRTRPLCPYPQVAQYKGTGSIDDAANFACANP